MKTINHFVNGKSFTGNSKKVGKVFNPATGEQSAEVRLASTKDVNEAIANAKNAFESWSNKPPLQRARIMFKFKELIEKNSDELTKIIVSEHGKVYEDAKGSLTRGLEVVEYCTAINNHLKSDLVLMFQLVLIAITCANRLGSVLVLFLLTFQRWCQCGCTLLQFPVVILSF